MLRKKPSEIGWGARNWGALGFISLFCSCYTRIRLILSAVFEQFFEYYNFLNALKKKEGMKNPFSKRNFFTSRTEKRIPPPSPLAAYFFPLTILFTFLFIPRRKDFYDEKRDEGWNIESPLIRALFPPLPFFFLLNVTLNFSARNEMFRGVHREL